MYQNCFTAGPFTEMKSTLCQVHRWPRPRAHDSPEAPRVPFHPYDVAPTRERESGALSISVCNQPFHQFGDIARRITFERGTTDYDADGATCNRLHVSGLLHEYMSCRICVVAIEGNRQRNAEICGERVGEVSSRRLLRICDKIVIATIIFVIWHIHWL